MALALGLLLCALAAREYPELTRLCDNPSNDYSTAVFQKDLSHPGAQKLPVVAAVVAIFYEVEAIKPVVAPKSFSVLSSCPDLLHLLCVQRT